MEPFWEKKLKKNSLKRLVAGFRLGFLNTLLYFRAVPLKNTYIWLFLLEIFRKEEWSQLAIYEKYMEWRNIHNPRKSSNSKHRK